MTTVHEDGLRLDFSAAPHDPIQRLVWLSGVWDVLEEQVTRQWRAAYFDARATGRFQAALDLHLHSRKRALAMTRSENERRGRPLKWGDGFYR